MWTSDFGRDRARQGAAPARLLTERDHTVLELTHNWDTERYELGTGYGHVALGVEDVYRACDELRAKGARIVREPGPMKHGGSEIAFVEDPDEYKIELIQLRGRSD